MRDDPVPTPQDTPAPQDTQLSAFLDGELPAGEAELLIRRLERDGQLQQVFGRYALIGEVMRTPASSRGGMASREFAARVSAALSAEAAPAAPVVAPAASAPAGKWFRPAAGFSIAAGVAIASVAFLTVDTEPQPVAASGTPAQLVATDAPAAEEASYIVPEITVTGPLVPQARLTNYVMAHSEYSSPLGRRNVLSGMLADEPGAPDGAVPVGFVPDQVPATVERP